MRYGGNTLIKGKRLFRSLATWVIHPEYHLVVNKVSRMGRNDVMDSLGKVRT